MSFFFFYISLLFKAKVQRKKQIIGKGKIYNLYIKVRLFKEQG